jgi:hypothetical protein
LAADFPPTDFDDLVDAPFFPFLPGDFFATTLTGVLGASFSSIASSSASGGLTAGAVSAVSPKWMGAFLPPDP